MKLIGMLDSPFVRRVAVTLAARSIPFEHESISVFREMERFAAVNPLLKSPSLIADDGTILMESSVILHWIEGISGVPLLPVDPASRTRAARRVALGLVAAEKAVQIEYERKRPEHERTASWQERIAGQVAAAWGAIENELADDLDPLALDGITIVAAWGFGRFVTPDHAPPERFLKLSAFAVDAEALPPYKRFPVDG